MHRPMHRRGGGVGLAPRGHGARLSCVECCVTHPRHQGTGQSDFSTPGGSGRGGGTGGGGGATPRFWTPTTPPTNCWPEAPWGGASEGVFREGEWGGGIRGAGGGAPGGSVGGGGPSGAIRGVGGGGGGGHRLPLPPLALPLTIPSPGPRAHCQNNQRVLPHALRSRSPGKRLYLCAACYAFERTGPDARGAANGTNTRTLGPRDPSAPPALQTPKTGSLSRPTPTDFWVIAKESPRKRGQRAGGGGGALRLSNCAGWSLPGARSGFEEEIVCIACPKPPGKGVFGG